jgi:hypothetical protein
MLGMTAAPLVAGVLLSVLGGIVRVRAWQHAAVNACGGVDVRYRDVVAAHLGGAGFSGVIPARGGDAVKIGLLKRRTEGAPFGLLLGSLAPPAAVEALLTALLLVWALGTGVLGAPSPGQIPLPLVGAALVVAAAVMWSLARRAPRLLAQVRRGMGALRRPRLMLTRILPWIFVARLMRLAALACFLAAVGLPVTLAGALLLMAVQGGVGSGGPASATLRIAVLAGSMPAAVGVSHVSLDTAASLIGTQFAVTGASLAISLVIVARTLRTASPRRLAGYCRETARTLRATPPVAAQAAVAPAVTES